MARTLTDPATGRQVRHVSRREAGLPARSRAPRGTTRRPHAIKHHGVGRGNGVSLSAAKSIWRGYWRYHTQTLGWSDVGYTAGEADAPDVGGAVLDGRGWGRDGAHTQQGRNRDGYACCYIGDGRRAVGVGAWRGWRAWLWHGIRSGAITDPPQISGHDDWHPKLCPGPHLKGPLAEKSRFDRPAEIPDDEQEDEMAVPTQVVVTETADKAHEEPIRRVLIDYATRTAHHIKTSAEDDYWRRLARSKVNPEVMAGGRWSTDRLRKHCAKSAIDL